MIDSKFTSAVESALNMVSGFLVSWAMWAWLVGPLYNAGIVTQSFFITLIFTVTSVMRSYFWRRFFAAGWAMLTLKYLRSL